MASKDLHSSVTAVLSIAPAVLTTDTDGTGVDVSKYDSAELVFFTGIEGVTLSGTDKITLEIEESDTEGSGYTDVAAADLIGEEALGVVKTLDANAETPAIYRVGYIGSKRYIRAVLNFAGTHGTGTPCSALVLLGHPRVAPLTQA